MSENSRAVFRTTYPTSVVNALGTFAGFGVAIADRVLVDVSFAIAFHTRLAFAWVAEEAVYAVLASSAWKK